MKMRSQLWTVLMMVVMDMWVLMIMLVVVGVVSTTGQSFALLVALVFTVSRTLHQTLVLVGGRRIGAKFRLYGDIDNAVPGTKKAFDLLEQLPILAGRLGRQDDVTGGHYLRTGQPPDVQLMDRLDYTELDRG